MVNSDFFKGVFGFGVTPAGGEREETGEIKVGVQTDRLMDGGFRRRVYSWWKGGSIAGDVSFTGLAVGWLVG